VFISSAYYIEDWYDFGLWQPSYGYEWIRVGADAVLVNLANGQIVDVVPGVYYD
jgi:Ni/Co efflux regulator RcnB